MTIATSSNRIWGLIPCAGVGQRAGTLDPKQYARLLGQPLVQHTTRAFEDTPAITATLVVLHPDDEACPLIPTSRLRLAHCGGEMRAHSVRNGLLALRQEGAQDTDWVLVHDAARCLITPQAISHLIHTVLASPNCVGGILAAPLSDTLKVVDVDQKTILQTESRERKWCAQTPQIFRLGRLLQALKDIDEHITDEASAIERLGDSPIVVANAEENFKVTYPEDFKRAEAVLQARHHADSVLQGFRIGQGWDTHALVEGRALILGGVQIPHSKGLLGHSDADALLHAIIDALLGAAGLGDIGRHFSDKDPQFKDVNSMKLLRTTLEKIQAAGFAIVNIDSTIIAQAPKLARYIPEMQQQIASCLSLDPQRINIKAKTAEGMNAAGLGLSIETQASALLVKY